jgi:hypothetical protein
MLTKSSPHCVRSSTDNYNFRPIESSEPPGLRYRIQTIRSYTVEDGVLQRPNPPFSDVSL